MGAAGRGAERGGPSRARARPARLRRDAARARARSTTWRTRPRSSTRPPPRSSAARSEGGSRSSSRSRRPELVERLVLVGAGLGGWDWSDAAKAGFAEEEEALERGDLAGAAAAQARMWLANDAGEERAGAHRGDDAPLVRAAAAGRGRGNGDLARAAGGGTAGRGVELRPSSSSAPTTSRTS